MSEPDARPSWFRGPVDLRGKPKVVEAEKEKELLPPIPEQIYMPEGIDFSQLWKDEEVPTGNLLHTILLIVITVLIFITLVVVAFKK